MVAIFQTAWVPELQAPIPTAQEENYMSTSVAPIAQPGKAATITDDVLHDILLMGALGASIFVKVPQHQQVAGLLIQSVTQLLQVVDAQLGIKPAAQS